MKYTDYFTIEELRKYGFHQELSEDNKSVWYLGGTPYAINNPIDIMAIVEIIDEKKNKKSKWIEYYNKII